MIYDVAAWFSRPVHGRKASTTRDDLEESVGAETPHAAAMKWFFRLSETERKYTSRVVVFPPKPKPVVPVYTGPEVRFERVGGKLVEVRE